MSGDNVALCGFRDTPYERWVGQHVRRVLAVRADKPVAVCWGVASPPGVRAAVVVPRDSAFLDGASLLSQRLSDSPAPRPMVREPVPTVRLDVDVLSWVGRLVSLAEEYEPFTPDDAGRFRRRDSLLTKLELMERPVADLLVVGLRCALEQAASAAGVVLTPELPWPDGKRFAVCITHDVDSACRRSLGYGTEKAIGAGLALVQGNLRRARRRFWEAVGLIFGTQTNPVWFFDRMTAMEDRHGFSSTFYLMLNETDWGRERGRRVRRYSLHRPEIQSLFRGLADRGREIGLHINYDAHDTPDEMEKEWVRLGEIFAPLPMAGTRSHYLRFVAPKTWHRQANCGMRYDVSVGWTEGTGFRGGTCWPYRPFDRQGDAPIRFWELGTHLMDTHLRNPSALLECASKALDEVRQVGGCACLLVHPAAQNDWTVATFLSTYERLMEVVAARRDAWVATPTQVIDHLEAMERSGA